MSEILKNKSEIIPLIDKLKDNDFNKSEFMDKTKELSKINGIGISTFSKLMYFFNVKINGNPCIIFDSRVKNALVRYSQTEFLDKYNQQNINSYPKFVEGISRISNDTGIEADSSMIDNIKNIKLRYLNFFKENIFENINLMISMKGVDRLCSGSTVFRTEIPCNNEMLGVLQITNGVHVSNKSLGLDNNGSLIDIIIIQKHVSLPISSDAIDAMHQEVEDLFINLTRKD